MNESDELSTLNIPVISKRGIFKERGNRAKYISWIIFGVVGISSISYNIYIGVNGENPKMSSFFACILSFLSILSGTFLGRCCLLFEEIRHVETRYGGRYCKMIKACFSGIHKGPVAFFAIGSAVVLLIVIVLTSLKWKQLRYLMYFLGGIGVGPLVVQLFSLNNLSEVDKSRLLEETGNCIAYGLAWSYYYNYLENAQKKFEAQLLEKSKKNNKKPTLSSDKLILLIPYNCFAVEKKLDEMDPANIELIKGYFDDDQFSVYKLKLGANKHKYYAVEFVKEPLITLRQLSIQNKTIKKENLEDEVTLFYKKLVDILTDVTMNPAQRVCLLAPYKIPKERVGNNGELIRLITHTVDKFSGVQPGGFAELDTTKNKKKKRKNKKRKNEFGKQLI